MSCPWGFRKTLRNAICVCSSSQCVRCSQEGREGRGKFSGGPQRMNPNASTTNREKKKNKAFMMVKHNYKLKEKKKRSFRDKQVKNRLFFTALAFVYKSSVHWCETESGGVLRWFMFACKFCWFPPVTVDIIDLCFMSVDWTFVGEGGGRVQACLYWYCFLSVYQTDKLSFGSFLLFFSFFSGLGGM